MEITNDPWNIINLPDVMDMLMSVKDFPSICHGWNNHFSCGCNTFSALYIYVYMRVYMFVCVWVHLFAYIRSFQLQSRDFKFCMALSWVKRKILAKLLPKLLWGLHRFSTLAFKRQDSIFEGGSNPGKSTWHAFLTNYHPFVKRCADTAIPVHCRIARFYHS